MSEDVRGLSERVDIALIEAYTEEVLRAREEYRAMPTSTCLGIRHTGGEDVPCWNPRDSIHYRFCLRCREHYISERVRKRKSRAKRKGS